MGIGKSFAIGNKAEQLVIAIFSQNGLSACKNDDHKKRYEYDVVFKHGKSSYTIEVKYDIMSNRTGNIAIEFFNSKKGEASGIAVTSATLWAQVLSPTEIYLTSVKRLRRFTESNTPKRIVYGGGDDNSDMMLFCKDVILEVFTNIYGMDAKSLKKLVKELT